MMKGKSFFFERALRTRSRSGVSGKLGS